MLPTPEMRFWSSSWRLIPEARRRTFATNASSSNSGSSGSRAMCAISGGSSAPPAETDSPPNIRWSTNLSSRPSEAPDEREPDPQVPLLRAVRRLHQDLARHPEVAEQRVAVVERQPEVLAAPAGRLDPPPGQRLGEAGRAARVAPHRARVQHVHPGDRRAEHVPLEPGADDLDLGELGHRGTPPSGRRGSRGRRPRRRSRSRPGRGRRRGRRRSRRTPSRRPPARPPSWSGRCRCRRAGCRPGPGR